MSLAFPFLFEGEVDCCLRDSFDDELGQQLHDQLSTYRTGTMHTRSFNEKLHATHFRRRNDRGSLTTAKWKSGA